MADDRTILAVDLGTQSLRVSAITTASRRLWHWQQPVTSFIDGEANEQDPAEWASLIDRALAEAASAGIRPDAVAAAGPLAGWVPLDADGQALARATMYFDGRTAPDTQLVASALHDRPAAPRPTIADPLPQLLRLQREQPSWLPRLHVLLDATGWLVHRLTGHSTLDAFTAIRLYDREVVARLGIDLARFGRGVAVGENVAPLSPQYASLFGNPRIPVIAATFDSKCAYLASGIEQDGEALDISGTVTSFGVASTRQVIDPARRIYSVPLGDRWLVRGSMGGTGSVLEWARATVLGNDFRAIEADVAAVPPGAHGVTFLPFHSGARAPLWNPHVRGAFLGLSLDTGRPAMARAVYEGLVYGLRHIVDTMAEAGVVVADIRLAGGLARSDLLSRMKADILGRPVIRLVDYELTTLGLVVIASVGLGAFPTRGEASAALVGRAGRIEPSALHDAYDEPYRRYLKSAALLGS
ncbi:xylulokinase [Phreatobacter aquaticus]|uniref:xylulokinase n=1 Tax=Phreatobacter aquaticus TaxID=2570229 RepID=UPI00143D8542|nr:FGGY-family carbohydrate kinase [Phreatobacter aquaticus]